MTIEDRAQVEHAVRGLWRDALALTVDHHPDRSFFELGGTSLRAARFVGDVHRRLGVPLSLAEMFATPSLSGLTRLVAAGFGGAPDVPEIVRHARSGTHPVNANQAARLTRISRARHEADARLATSFVIKCAYRIHGDLDPAALALAVDRVVDRHDAFRTAFDVDAQTQQVVADSGVRLQVAGPMTEDELWALLAEPFVLEAGGPARFVLARLADQQYLFGFAVDHLVSDAVSVRIMLDEIAGSYATILDPAGAPAPAGRPVQNHDLAYFEEQLCRHSRLGAEARSYWHGNAKGGSPMAPLAYPGIVGHPSQRGAPIRHDRRLATPAVRRFSEATSADGLALYSATVTALVLAAGERCGLAEVPVLSLMANRSFAGLDQAVGLVANGICLRVPVPGRTDRPAVAAVREQITEAMRFAFYPLHRLVRELTPADLGRPLLDTYLHFDIRQIPPVFQLSGCDVSRLPASPGLSPVSIGVWVGQGDGVLDLTLAHPTGLIPPTEGAALADALAAKLTLLVRAHEEAPPETGS